MATYIVDDDVDVRADDAHTWRAGTVTAVEDNRYEVTLDTPITADTWSGTTRKYGGSDTLDTVFIFKSVESMTSTEGDLIRTQGG